MNQDMSEWWNEEIHERYLALRWYLGIASTVVLLLKLLTWYFCTECNLSLPLQFSYPGFLVLFLLATKYVQKRPALLKAASAFFLSEVVNFSLLKMSKTYLSEHQPILLITSLMFIHLFELDFVHSPVTATVLLLKFIYQWYFEGLLSGTIPWTYLTTPYAAIISAVFVYNSSTFFKKQISYHYFLNRKALQTSKKRLKVLIKNLPDGILLLTADGNVGFKNETLKNHIDCQENAVVGAVSALRYMEGRKLSNFTDSQYLIDDLYECFSMTSNSYIVLGITEGHGQAVEWKVKKIAWDEKPALLISTRNVNNIIEFERQEAENKMKNAILRSVSHELRTPNTAIGALSELMMVQDTQMSESSHERLKVIKISSGILNSLINDLLDYSRMLAGVFSIQKQSCNPVEIIESCCDLIEMQACRKGLKIVKKIDPWMPKTIFTDPLRLSQIILNLLSNALKFTMKGKIEVCALVNSECKLKVLVKDTGVGIPEQKLRTIFDAFETVRGSSINPEGVGLGLNISNLLSQMLGNQTIRVSSKVGEGSTFWFVVDILGEGESVEILDETALESESEDVECIRLRPSISSKCSELDSAVPVLITDDNEFNRYILLEILKTEGIPCKEASNGKEAVDRICEADQNSKSFKLVIMDCDMPMLNGWDATKLVHRLYSEKRIRFMPYILGYTAYNSEEDINKCYECGMVGYILKPSSPETIIGLIKQYI